MDHEGPQVDRFFELSPDLLCIAGFDGFFKRVNQAWGDILGFSPDELQDRPFLDFVHPDDRVRTVAEANRLACAQHATMPREHVPGFRESRMSNRHWIEPTDSITNIRGIYP